MHSCQKTPPGEAGAAHRLSHEADLWIEEVVAFQPLLLSPGWPDVAGVPPHRDHTQLAKGTQGSAFVQSYRRWQHPTARAFHSSAAFTRPSTICLKHSHEHQNFLPKFDFFSLGEVLALLPGERQVWWPWAVLVGAVPLGKPSKYVHTVLERIQGKIVRIAGAPRVVVFCRLLFWGLEVGPEAITGSGARDGAGSRGKTPQFSSVLWHHLLASIKEKRVRANQSLCHQLFSLLPSVLGKRPPAAEQRGTWHSTVPRALLSCCKEREQKWCLTGDSARSFP